MTAAAGLATRLGEKDAIVVTGATSGIGRAIALEFHCRGHAVYATGRNGERAGASQQHATPAAEFARHVVGRVLAPRPRPVVTVGRGGYGLVALQQVVPVRHRDRLLSRKFRLNRLMHRPSPPQRAEGR